MKQTILILFVILGIQNVSADEFSMRKCALLPITDTLNNAIGFNVFKKTEEYLEDANWCQYISNSGILGIFSKYRDKLDEHLEDKNVLKVVSAKLKVGTLIRIRVVPDIKGINLSLDVIGENGEDIYFSEKTLVDKKNIDVIVQTIKNWLELYAQTIPYDGKVIGVLGDQVTMDVGAKYKIQIGQDFVIKKLENKKMHPLLKKVVEWDSSLLAEGKIYNVSQYQTLGSIKVYRTREKVKVGDWVRLEKLSIKDTFENRPYPEVASNRFGKLGLITLAMHFNDETYSTTTNSNKKMNNYIYGFSGKVEAWITRNYFAGLEYVKDFGTLKKTEGNTSVDSISVNNSKFHLVGGYKYLPLGFFNGPQVDFYGGWGSHYYGIETNRDDKFSDFSMYGILLGVGGSIPFERIVRIFARAELIPFASVEEESGFTGTKKSATSMMIEFGAKYQYLPTLSLDLSYQALSDNAKFKSGVKEISVRDNALKAGVSFNY
jgi:hypothetical protein